MQQGGGSETEVTWEDQLSINKFSRLNNRFHEHEGEIRIAEDASNELILSDEEVIRFHLGEVFAHVRSEEVEGRMEEMKEENVKNMEKLKEDKYFNMAEMAELKKILYGKFKESINLEDD